MFGMLTEAQVDRILLEGLVLEDNVRWMSQPSNTKWVQFGAFLDSPHESTVRLNMAVSVLLPEKYKIIVLRGEQALRRLDVRGSHGNPPAGTPGVWHRQTHKHRWTDRFGDKEAYTPPDITTTTFDPGEHEATFRALCKECNIEFRGSWSDPPRESQISLDV